MCLRFVPKFIKEASVISDGQKCVGRSVENGSLIKRAKHGITIFSILVTWSLENAIETSDSMKCRGYGEKGRTAFSLYHFDKRDFLCFIFMIITFGAAIWGFSNGTQPVLHFLPVLFSPSTSFCLKSPSLLA